MENLTQFRNLSDITLLLAIGVIGSILFLIVMNFIYKNRYTSPENYLKYFKRK
jgi:hypothetical protein